jgi:hypothetical protein
MSEAAVPTPGPQITLEQQHALTSRLLGLDVDSANDLVAPVGWQLQVVRPGLVYTSEYLSYRIRVMLDDAGVIAEVRFG